MIEIFKDRCAIDIKDEITDRSDFQFIMCIKIVKEEAGIEDDFEVGFFFKNRTEIAKKSVSVE